MNHPSRGGIAGIRRALSAVMDRAWGLHAAVEGNPRVLVITEGVSSITFQWAGAYLSLYMLALGVTTLQVGLLASLLTAAQVVSIMLGGYMADRFGRVRMLVWSDILFWGIPFLLYAIAQNPWYFVAGRLINGFVYVVMPAFECLFVEDVPGERRAAVFGMLRFWTAAATLTTPIAGALVERLGMVTAGRLIMAAAGVVAVATAVYRNFTMTETTMGRRRMAALAGSAPWAALREYGVAVRAVLSQRATAGFIGMRVVGQFNVVMWSTYSAIYLTDAAGVALPKSAVALLPFVAALVTLTTTAFAAERIRHGGARANMLLGGALSIAGSGLFLLAPREALPLVLLSTAVSALSVPLFYPAMQSAWANMVDDRSRAQVAATSAALIALGSIPAGPLAGLLYTAGPRLPFVVAAALQMVMLWMVARMRV